MGILFLVAYCLLFTGCSGEDVDFDNPNPKTTYDDYIVYRITKNDGLALINYLNA